MIFTLCSAAIIFGSKIEDHVSAVAPTTFTVGYVL